MTQRPEPTGLGRHARFSIDGRRRGPVVSPKQLLTSCFRLVQYGPATVSTCAIRDVRARRRRSMPLAIAAERQDTGRGEAQPPVDLRARRSLLLLVTNQVCDCASISTTSATQVQCEVPVVPWSCSPPSTVHADPSRLEGPRLSTILVEAAADRRDACCERAVRVRRHVRRVERAARREATMSCLTATLWL